MLYHGLAPYLLTPPHHYLNFSDAHSVLHQAYFFRAKLPITDYINDTKTVLDQAPRVLNALLDMAVEEGHLDVVLALTILSKMIIQVFDILFLFLSLDLLPSTLHALQRLIEI